MIKFRWGGESGNGEGSSAVGRGCLAAFGLVFAGMGLLFVVVLAFDVFRSAKGRTWDRHEVTLTETHIESEKSAEEPFVLRVSYSYKVDGKTYLGNRYHFQETRSDEYEKLALKLRRLKGEDVVRAYVNPDNPEEAVLYPGSFWKALLILFPLIFVAIGVAVLVAALRMKKGAGTRWEAISSKSTKSGNGAMGMIILGGVFTLVGLGLTYPLLIKPLRLSLSAKNWVETPCKIIWGQVRSHRSDDGTTYSVDLFYSYQVEGVEHRSNRYDFIGGSSSGSGSKRKEVQRYLKSSDPVCYVNPKLPEQAVLVRELGWSGLLALIPVVVLLIGVSLTIGGMAKRRKKGSGVVGRADSGRPQPESGPATLTPGKKRMGIALILLAVALFWNGIVFGFLYRAAWVDKEGGLFLKIFSIPFMLVGVGIVLGLFHYLLALFNPKAILTLEPAQPVLGGVLRGRWKLRGSARRLKKLRFVLRGVEKATYQRGTDTVTEERTFYAVVLVEHDRIMQMTSGTFEHTLPHDLMYSLKLASNEILWRLEVHGEIGFWPDVNDKYDLTVLAFPIEPSSH